MIDIAMGPRNTLRVVNFGLFCFYGKGTREMRTPRSPRDIIGKMEEGGSVGERKSA